MKPKRIVYLAAVFAFGVCNMVAAGQSSQTTTAKHLRAEHRAVVELWLAKKSTLRLATERDCRNKRGLAATRQEFGKNYHPYYAIGDFNRDGHQDFAVAVIDSQKRSRKFAIAIFNGPHNPKTHKGPTFFNSGTDLSDGGLIARSGKDLLAGVFESDDCVVLKPQGKSYVMKSCL